ncbi:MAG: bifunctional phosphoribosylaminoimidazolecarboxamide formyltransferase/IMP cyclohydrolase [Pseudomonadota bacterium]
MPADPLPVRTALLSVSDKTGLVDLARQLTAAGVRLVSTGGTARALREAGIGVRDVSEITEFPEMMGGRVKTLHPMIHGGLLADRSDPAHLAAMEAHGIPSFDLLVVNLYPFEATLARGAAFDECVETIDIGGPAMIRAAAKNHASVAVVTDPQDYAPVLAEIAAGGTTAATRRRLAATAYARTAAYDAAIAGWMARETEAPWPRRTALAGRLAEVLRYGENPHQEAGFYLDGTARPGVATATQVQGKALSYNNINDTDAAYELMAEFPANDGPACVIVKHANPCGVARGASLAEAYGRSYDCDRVSAFGGIVALNAPVDGPVAEAITQIFTEVVIAPGADDDARALFAKKPSLRLLVTDGLPDPDEPRRVLRPVSGGFLWQDADTGHVAPPDLRIVTQRAPSAEEFADLLFAWRVAKHVKSNAIVYAKGRATVGIGAGQMSRVDSVRIAARKAEDMAEALGLAEAPTLGSAVASDAFFPFADGLEAAARAGARSVIQPGGSKRDDEVIAAADAAGLAMVFTGMRHFRH